MIPTKRLLKVSAIWTSIAYIVCFSAIALYPDLRTLFFQYALHSDVYIMDEMISGANFIVGLIFWNVITFLGVGLFAVLYNGIKK